MKNNKMQTRKFGNKRKFIKTDYYQYAFNHLRRHGLVINSEEANHYINRNNLDLISQVEFQPGFHCDLYRCPHCYGNGQNLMDGDLELRHYISVLDEIKEQVPLIQISGVKTEPLTNPITSDIIQEIKNRNFGCGLHTKGYRLNSDIIDLLTDDVEDRESFITVSIDANESDEYIKLHDIDTSRKDALGIKAENYFQIVANNIEKLWMVRESKNSKLRINIALLILDGNHSIDKLNTFIDLFQKYTDVIRFSIPQNTNTGSEPYLSSNRRQLIKTLRQNYGDDRKIKILTATDSDHNTYFAKCYAQLFQAVIDKAGNVFPCPQTAVKEYRNLIYGNIKNSSFSEIIFSRQREAIKESEVDKELECRICDRKDEEINIVMEQLL